MASIKVRGNKLWAQLKGVKHAGKWDSIPTDFSVGDETAALRWARAYQRKIDAQLGAAGTPNGPLTLRMYTARWLKEREDRSVLSVESERRWLTKYVMPEIGDVGIADVRIKHVRDMVKKLTASGTLAPRSVLHVISTLHNVFEGAITDEVLDTVNPVKLKKHEMPSKIDADPEWRSQATYTVHEVQQLISDARIPVERRVQYALKAIAGLRHGEVAALCWRHIDRTAEPLARINVVQAARKLNKPTRTIIKSTKNGETRAVPLHPTLAKILASWKLEHWERTYGRQPTADDFVVPTRTMKPVDGADAVNAMKADLATLGLRVEAGKKRDRGGHDLRSWYKTRCIEDGGDSLIVRLTTHAPPKDVNAGYERFSWSTVCREIGKLKIDVLDGKVLELSTALSTASKKAGARWSYVVTPKGLEPLFSA